MLDATPAGTSSNTYATLAEADQILAFRADSAVDLWSIESAPVREAALMEAAQVMNGLRFFGHPWSTRNGAPLQVLAFPRDHQVDEGGNPVVERDVKRAQVEIAVDLLRVLRRVSAAGLGGDLASLRAMGLSSATIGGASMSFSEAKGAFEDARLSDLSSAGFPIRAAVILARFISRTGNIRYDAQDLVRRGEVRILESFRRTSVENLVRDMPRVL